MIAPVIDKDAPTRWMLLSAWTKRTGYSRHTFNHKRDTNVWPEGDYWIKAPDNKILVDWKRIEEWMESRYGTNERTGSR